MLLRSLSEIPGVRVRSDFRLSEATTLRVGGTPAAALECASQEAVSESVSLLDAHGLPVLIVGGGSNLVVADGPLDEVAVLMGCRRIAIDANTGVVRAEAGATWEEVVSSAVDAGLGGIECLSGIPGSAGATPVQNVGAYGVEVADVLTRVRLFNRRSGRVEWVPVGSLDLGYRASNLKYTHRAVVLEVELQLSTDGLSAPLRFGALAARLGAEGADERFPVAEVREAVLDLRRGKGMVLDSADHDTWSAGSFFTNPVVPEELADRVEEIVRGDAAAEPGDDDGGPSAGMPRFRAGEGAVKLSAAWLIERAGFPRGYLGPGGRVGISTKHTLALTNRGGARTSDLIALAREVRDGVERRFGVRLIPEPVWVGAELDS